MIFFGKLGIYNVISPKAYLSAWYTCNNSKTGLSWHALVIVIIRNHLAVIELSFKKIKPGQEILITTNSAFYKNVYESRVISVDKDMLCISIPYYKGLFVPLNVGFVLNLRINTGDEILCFTSEILYRNVSERCFFLRLPLHYKTQEKTSNRKCKFVTVTSSKGGVGKSTFVINYAIALSRLGKKVALFDADLGMANIDVLLKCNTSYNIVDVIDGRKNINEVISPAPGGINIIAGGSGMQRLSNLTSVEYSRITNGFNFLESNYDYVIFDTSAGLSKNVTSFIYSSDETIVLTTPEPHAITDAYSIIKVILENNREVALKLVVNKCETPAEGAEVLNRITNVVKNFLNYSMEPFGTIPESKLVSRSIKKRNPYILAYPSSKVAHSIEDLAEKEVQSVLKEGNSASHSNNPFINRLLKLLQNA